MNSDRFWSDLLLKLRETARDSFFFRLTLKLLMQKFKVNPQLLIDKDLTVIRSTTPCVAMVAIYPIVKR